MPDRPTRPTRVHLQLNGLYIQGFRRWIQAEITSLTWRSVMFSIIVNDDHFIAFQYSALPADGSGPGIDHLGLSPKAQAQFDSTVKGPQVACPLMADLSF